jgi:hypothetical protein
MIVSSPFKFFRAVRKQDHHAQRSSEHPEERDEQFRKSFQDPVSIKQQV